jgi:hypothetical protein
MAKVMYLRQIQTSNETGMELYVPGEHTFTWIDFALWREADEGDDSPSDLDAKRTL